MATKNQKDWNEKLWKACEVGKLEDVKKAVANGADVNVVAVLFTKLTSIITVCRRDCSKIPSLHLESIHGLPI